MFGLRFTPAEQAFRAELRAWLAANAPGDPPPADEERRRDWQRAWQRRLADAGYLAIHWPRAYGGRDAGLAEQVIYSEEMARVRAPEILDAVALNIVAPVLIHAGTDAQRAHHLPRIRCAEEVWCLGFSEPNAGSDLASLRTRAVRDGDCWVVSGQKVWSSKAHFADWLLFLARTAADAPRHKGITCLAVSMQSAGVTWRPLVQLSGRREFNEVFLEEVRVPAANTIGPVHGGWPLIRTALAHERGTLWAFDFKVRLQNLARAAVDLYRTGGRAVDRDALRDQVAKAWVESEVFAAHTMRVLPALHHGAAEAAALTKVLGSEIHQRTCELAMVLRGPMASVRDEEWHEQYLYSRSVTISSGTSEVLRNVLAQALGLPRR